MGPRMDLDGLADGLLTVIDRLMPVKRAGVVFVQGDAPGQLEAVDRLRLERLGRLLQRLRRGGRCRCCGPRAVRRDGHRVRAAAPAAGAAPRPDPPPLPDWRPRRAARRDLHRREAVGSAVHRRRLRVPRRDRRAGGAAGRERVPLREPGGPGARAPGTGDRAGASSSSRCRSARRGSTGLDVYGVSVPAQEVGGDYFDYLDGDDATPGGDDRRRQRQGHVGGALHVEAAGHRAVAARLRR